MRWVDKTKGLIIIVCLIEVFGSFKRNTTVTFSRYACDIKIVKNCIGKIVFKEKKNLTKQV